MSFINGSVVTCRGEGSTGLYLVKGYDPEKNSYRLEHLTRHTDFGWKNAEDVFAPTDFGKYHLFALLAKANAEGLDGKYYDIPKPELTFSRGIRVERSKEGNFDIFMIVYSNDPEDPGDSDETWVSNLPDIDKSVAILKVIAAIPYPASPGQVSTAVRSVL